MSSLTRKIQRGSKLKYRAGSIHQKGSQLGVSNPKAKDLLARLEREKKSEVRSN